MTREEAIDIIRQYECCKEHIEACEMAISALEQVTKVQELLEYGYLSCVHHDYRAWKFMKDLEKIVGEEEQKSCEDAVSREAVSQAVNDVIAEYIPLMDGAMEMMPLDVAKAIMRVPSVTVRQTGCDKCAMNNSGSKYCDNCKYKRQTGEWIDGKCSMCGEHAPYWSMATTYYESKFCPNCGCRMVKEGESE